MNPNGVTVTNLSGRIILIGDIHGCLDVTKELLDKCQVTSNDTIIFLGDLVDRGPDSGRCVDLVMDIEAKQKSPASILGNHEDKHLKYHSIELFGQDPNVTIPTHIATRKQLKEEHYDYFEKLPHFIRLPQYNAVAVHAGVYPGRKIEDQKIRHLLHLQMVNPKEEPNESIWPSQVPKESNNWKFWTHLWDGSEKIIFGHTVLNKPLVTDKVIGLDGGAVFGGEMHALILPEWKIVSVEGKFNYGNGIRGRGTNPVQRYTLHDDVTTHS